MGTQVNQEIQVPAPDVIRLLWRALEVGSLDLSQSDVDVSNRSVTFEVCSDGSATAHTVTLHSDGRFAMKTVIVLGEKL